ncbi:hypothetical protein BJV74DRAFT_795886 [Russula compacta]|nr:hypothetical protein BJV74DRAFT_795886 [Russula compacta]
MADTQPQAHHFPGDSFPRTVPRLRDPHVPHNDGAFPATGNGQPECQWEDVPPAIRNGAMQGRLQDPYHINVANYRIAHYPPLPGGPTAPYMHVNVELDQGGPEREEAIYPLDLSPQGNQENEIFGYDPQRLLPGSTQAAFPNPSAHQAPALDRPAAENLRRLASRYLQHPDSQIDMIRMEPGSAGRYRVVIVLEMAGFL